MVLSHLSEVIVHANSTVITRISLLHYGQFFIVTRLCSPSTRFECRGNSAVSSALEPADTVTIRREGRTSIVNQWRFMPATRMIFLLSDLSPFFLRAVGSPVVPPYLLFFFTKFRWAKSSICELLVSQLKGLDSKGQALSFASSKPNMASVKEFAHSAADL
jgi:hypothetical protein